MFAPLYNDHIYRATLTGRDDQGDPSYGSPTKIRGRRTEQTDTGDMEPDAENPQTVFTTAEVDSFSETDLIWLSENDETDEADGQTPESVGFSETLGRRLARVEL